MHKHQTQQRQQTLIDTDNNLRTKHSSTQSYVSVSDTDIIRHTDTDIRHVRENDIILCNHIYRYMSDTGHAFHQKIDLSGGSYHKH